MLLDLFEEDRAQAKRNVYTLVFEVMEQVAVNAFLTGGADELLDDKMYKPAESQDFTQGFVHHLLKSSTFTMTVSRFVKQQTEKSFASIAKSRQYVSQELPVKEKLTSPSPLTDCSPEYSKKSNDDKQEKKEERPSLHNHLECSSCSRCCSSRHTDD